MKITCDNCGAVYRIPEAKLTKEVSRATCKKCGHKIVIRKPSSSLSGGGFGSSSYSFDDEDDGVVNHEERTVIATVPELQRFDSTPPLSVPGSEDEVAQGESEVTAPHTQGTPASTATTTSTSREAVAAANNLPTGPGAAPLPSGVPIPGANNFDMGPIPLALGGVGLLGTLFLLDGWHWSGTTLTAIGFGVALFAQLAVLMALLDIKKQVTPRLPLVLGVPFAVVVVLFLLLLMVGKEEMAFLNTGDVTQVVAVNADSSDLAGAEYVTEEYVDPKTGEKKTRQVRRKRKVSSSNIPSVSNGEAVATVAGMPKTEVKSPGLVALGSGASDARRGPSGPSIMDKRSQNVGKIDAGKIRKALATNDRVSNCISKNLKRQKTSGREKYYVEVAPSGKVLGGFFDKKSVLVASEMERCITEQVKRMSFDSFKGEKSEKVAHDFVM